MTKADQADLVIVQTGKRVYWGRQYIARSLVHFVFKMLLSHQKLTLARRRDASLLAAIIWTLVVAADLVRGKRMSLALHIWLSDCTPLVAYLFEEGWNAGAACEPLVLLLIVATKRSSHHANADVALFHSRTLAPPGVDTLSIRAGLKAC